MRNGSRILVASIVLALAVALGVFGWVKNQDGPDEHSQPGFLRTYICADPTCRTSFDVTPEEEKQMGLDPWNGPGICPTCGKQTLRRAERCTSCGELVPSPDPDKLLGAKCPVCGKEIFGPLGGKWPADPHRSKNPQKE